MKEYFELIKCKLKLYSFRHQIGGVLKVMFQDPEDLRPNWRFQVPNGESVLNVFKLKNSPENHRRVENSKVENALEAVPDKGDGSYKANIFDEVNNIDQDCFWCLNNLIPKIMSN